MPKEDIDYGQRKHPALDLTADDLGLAAYIVSEAARHSYGDAKDEAVELAQKLRAAQSAIENAD